MPVWQRAVHLKDRAKRWLRRTETGGDGPALEGHRRAVAAAAVNRGGGRVLSSGKFEDFGFRFEIV